MSDRPTVGVIGLGVMGRPMAGHLLRAGFPLVVHDLRAAPVGELVAAGAVDGGSPSGVAARADVVVLSLPDTPDVQSVLLGAGGVLQAARRGAVVVDTSTIAPAAARAMARAAQERGVSLIDAPVSGGEPGALAGALTVMAGGDAAALETATPVLRAFARSVVHIGAAGAGQIAKACNQIIMAVAIAAIGEALVLARAAGVDPAGVRRALMGGFAQSQALDVLGARMLERNFRPGFQVRLHVKDLGIALETAHASGLPLLTTGLVFDLLRSLAARGGEALDNAALVTVLEQLSGLDHLTVGAPPRVAAPPAGEGAPARVGVVGLGVMGRPMATNLLRAGFPVVVHNRSQAAVHGLVALGAVAAGSPAELARQADVVLLSLPDGDTVRQIVAGERGLLEGSAPGSVIVDTSTIAPDLARELADIARARGVAMLDAPVSGGEAGAREATLSIMVGGEAEAAARVEPVLRAVGRNITYLGGPGGGQIAKACNQIIVAATIIGVAEALTLAGRAGVDVRLVREALLGGSASSRILELHGQRMIDRSFQPGGKTRFQLKDLAIVLAAARSAGAVLPLTRLVADLFRTLIARGGADLDHAAVVAVVEGLGGVEGSAAP